MASVKSVLVETLSNPVPGAEAAFVRRRGDDLYTVYASWDKSLNTWTQWGAPKEIIEENVNDVQRFYYSKTAFDFQGIANAVRGDSRSRRNSFRRFA